jgi:ribosomal protein S27AE
MALPTAPPQLFDHCDRCNALAQLTMQGALLLCGRCAMTGPLPECLPLTHPWQARAGGIWLCGMCGLELTSEAITTVPAPAQASTAYADSFC